MLSNMLIWANLVLPESATKTVVIPTIITQLELNLPAITVPTKACIPKGMAKLNNPETIA
jgi:hypothetical protein